ncbi:MAG: hypothetical protein J7L04_08275, partial [Bacteroidales bacterium]|nr:hypothetical protein [Bacteroidales bacterium]
MEHNVAGSFIINYLSILDKYFPDKKTWNKFLDSDHKKLLLAYRHLRLSFSHSSEGSRIDPSKIKDKNNPKLEDRFGFADEFDEI